MPAHSKRIRFHQLLLGQTKGILAISPVDLPPEIETIALR